MMPNKKGIIMNREKMLEEILTLRKIKERIKTFKVMGLNNKAVFLNAIESYENELKDMISIQNNNVKLLKEDGIENDGNIIEIPLDPNDVLYEEYRTHGNTISLLKKIVYLDNTYRSISSYIMALGIPREEEILIYKSIKRYAEELNLLKRQQENNANYNSDIYSKTEEYVPLSNYQIFNELYEKSKKSNK